jgi:CHAT domain-containing protein
MTGLYRRIAAGKSTARALAEAQRAARAEHPHPWEWATFSVTGAGRWGRSYMLRRVSG